MARYRDEEYTRASNAPAWTMAIIMLIAVVAFLAYLAPDLLPSASAPPAAPSDVRGKEAPPAAVRRAPAAPAASGGAIRITPIPGMAQSQAEVDAQYDALVQAGAQAAATPVPLPLPLNSQGEPIIDQAQADQQRLSLQLAEQEGNAAADQLLQAQRATAYADAASRPPDISAQEVATMTGRNPCAVPRADPHTCADGVYKPTPVN